MTHSCIRVFDDVEIRVHNFAQRETRLLTKAVIDGRHMTAVNAKGQIFSTRLAGRPRGYYISWTSHLGLVEDMIRLGLLPKKRFEEVKAVHDKNRAASTARYAAREILRDMPSTGVKLTRSQVARLKKVAGSE